MCYAFKTLLRLLFYKVYLQFLSLTTNITQTHLQALFYKVFLRFLLLTANFALTELLALYLQRVQFLK